MKMVVDFKIVCNKTLTLTLRRNGLSVGNGETGSMLAQPAGMNVSTARWNVYMNMEMFT